MVAFPSCCARDDWFLASEEGEVLVVAVGDSVEILARNELAEAIKATPAIAGNTLYVRTLGNLIAIRESD